MSESRAWKLFCFVRTKEEEQIRQGQAAQKSRIQRGQVSRARQELTGAALAPKRPQLQLRNPARSVGPNANVRSHGIEKFPQGCPSVVAPEPAGCTIEMLRVCLDDAVILVVVVRTVEDFARGQPMLCNTNNCCVRSGTTPLLKQSVLFWHGLWSSQAGGQQEKRKTHRKTLVPMGNPRTRVRLLASCRVWWTDLKKSSSERLNEWSKLVLFIACLQGSEAMPRTRRASEGVPWQPNHLSYLKMKRAVFASDKR